MKRMRSIHLFEEFGVDANTLRTLRIWILPAVCGTIWTNITNGVALSGYFKGIGASDFLYGLVYSLPLIANAFQLFASYILEKTLKRTRMLMVAGLIQRAVWIPFALVPYVIPMSLAATRIWAAVLLALTSAAMVPFVNVAACSLTADVVPMRIRGRYFSARAGIAAMGSMVIGLLVGWLMDVLPGMAGYSAAFVIAGVLGMADIAAYAFMRLPPLSPAPTRSGILKMLGRVLKDRQYMRMVLCVTAWMFSVQLCAPYFNVYMRASMGLSNFQAVFLGQILVGMCTVLAVRRWGRALDSYGNSPVLVASAFLSAFIPLFWVCAGPNTVWLAFVSYAINGLAYCAVDLSCQNLYLAQAREENKSMYFAVYFIFTQLPGMALGASAGGWLLDNLLCGIDGAGIVLIGQPFTRYNALFLLSGVLRMAVVFFLLSRIREAGAKSPLAIAAGARNALRQGLWTLRVTLIRRRAARKFHREIQKNKKSG